jgi:hypothetical protein
MTSVSMVQDGNRAVPEARSLLFSVTEPNFFAVLGVRPIMGRTFESDADDTAGAYPVAVLSYAAWQRLFSGDREIVSRTLRVNGHIFTIIGVAPQNFSGLWRGAFPSLFVPVSMLGHVRPTWTARPLTDANLPGWLSPRGCRSARARNKPVKWPPPRRAPSAARRAH